MNRQVRAINLPVILIPKLALDVYPIGENETMLIIAPVVFSAGRKALLLKCGGEHEKHDGSDRWADADFRPVWLCK